MKNLLAAASLIALVAGPALAADNQMPAPMSGQGSAHGNQDGGVVNGQSLNQQDHEFMMKATSGGRAEVAAGKMAMEHGASTGVRVFGRWMVTDHTAIGDMLTEAAKGAGVMLPTGIDKPEQDSLAGLKNLQGGAFDHKYITAQIDDHKKTLELFKREAQSGGDPALKGLARSAIPMIEQHLAAAQELKRAPESVANRGSNAGGPNMAMEDPQQAQPAKQNPNPALRHELNQQGAQKLKVEGK